ncbi:glycoside hydrolase family 55 protein [Anaeromyxobacter oryzae]|uniref:Rhamnogalacturonase A/B/Epimerase-like pectate lyase domain-containing protein n=1 Tax=Anaeromyxobacter oryzae TaxID=2918170 RepID=A0ABM7WVB5_9BACT|nr:glycoside hydrolase family 55 protein [Anaeromyxobacter oryzae]BDG03444.1 hypothetical protein AMOR_24400 [Anaeromyxobacter oryzae]
MRHIHTTLRLLAASSLALANVRARAEAPSSTTNANEWLVTAAHSNTARTLRDRFADALNVRDFGATGDGRTDDTHAVEAAYAALGPRGGTITFPPGVYRFNLTVSRGGVYLRGSGVGSTRTQGGEAGTIFRPANPRAPVLQFGDCGAGIYFGGVADVALHGDTSTIADGLRVCGAFFLDFQNLSVFGFGGDNVFVTSAKAAPTSFIHFRRFVSRGAGGAAFRASYGPSYTTALFLSDFSLMDSSAFGKRALVVDGTRIWLSDGYLDVHDRKGILITSGGSVVGSGVSIDTVASSDVTVEVNSPPTAIQRFIQGEVILNGRVAWSDGTVSPSMGATSHYSRYARLFSPSVDGYMSLGDASHPQSTQSDGSVRLGREGQTGSGTETVILSGAALRPDMTAAHPLETGSAGALWRAADTGQLRFASTVRRPASDSAGAPLATFVAVPRTSTSSCNPGEWSADTTFLYVCVAPSSWKRTPVASW